MAWVKDFQILLLKTNFFFCMKDFCSKSTTENREDGQTIPTFPQLLTSWLSAALS